MTPAVTVLMSVHNGLPFLAEAVSSVLAQTFQDFEFLILDDASTDGTADYLRTLSDPRVRVITLTENIGLTAALNRGLRESQGESSRVRMLMICRIRADWSSSLAF